MKSVILGGEAVQVGEVQTREKALDFGSAERPKQEALSALPRATAACRLGQAFL